MGKPPIYRENSVITTIVDSLHNIKGSICKFTDYEMKSPGFDKKKYLELLKKKFKSESIYKASQYRFVLINYSDYFSLFLALHSNLNHHFSLFVSEHIHFWVQIN